MTKQEQQILLELKDTFLSRPNSPYWKSEQHIELYDAYFAKRISWKWQNIIKELKFIGWKPTTPILYDMGCGTGAATETFLNYFEMSEIYLWDKSDFALNYSLKKIKNSKPLKRVPKDSIVLLSHVINEISKNELEVLFFELEKAQTILWAEPGTFDESHSLIRAREILKKNFNVIAPCPKTETCGLLNHKKDWCHHKVTTPTEVFQDSAWKEFSNKVKIDLRSLNTSYLVLDKTLKPNFEHRMIGEPRVYTGYLNYLDCSNEGVVEKRILKKEDKNRFKKLSKTHSGWYHLHSEQ